MTITDILNGLKGKVLELRDIELLKSAYELQQRNIEQLQANNAAIAENRDLVKEKLARAEQENDRLRAENAELKNLVPVEQLAIYTPSELARQILGYFRNQDVDHMYENDIYRHFPGPRLESQQALEELKSGQVLEIGGFGDKGAHYYLTTQGRELVLTLPQITGRTWLEHS